MGASSLLPAPPRGLEKPLISFPCSCPQGQPGSTVPTPFCSYQAPAISGRAVVKSKVSPNVPMSCSTLCCPTSHPSNRLVAGRAFSHPTGVQAWDYHQLKQEAAAEQEDTHPVSVLVLEAGSTHRQSCSGSVPGPLAVQTTCGATSPLFPKCDCLDEASAMWGLALAFLMAPFHLPRTAFQTSSLAQSSLPLLPRPLESQRYWKEICVQPGRRMSPK